MGLNKLSLKFLNKHLKLLGNFNDKEMLELGCQEVKKNAKKSLNGKEM